MSGYTTQAAPGSPGGDDRRAVVDRGPTSPPSSEVAHPTTCECRGRGTFEEHFCAPWCRNNECVGCFKRLIRCEYQDAHSDEER